MKRKDLITHIKLAAANGDKARATELYINNRISREAYNKAYREGARMAERLNGRDVYKTTHEEVTSCE